MPKRPVARTIRRRFFPYLTTYRFRTSVGYSIFTLAIILVMACLLMFFLNRKLADDVDVANRSQLSQAQIFGDTYVAGRIKLFVIEKFLDISQDNSVMDFFTGQSSTNNLRQVQQSVVNLRLYGAYVESAYLYRQIDDTLVASDSGVTFKALGNRGAEPGRGGPPLFDADLIRRTTDEFPEARWISPRENRTRWGNTNTITYCQPIPMFQGKTSRLGCFIANIDADGLRKLLLSARSDPFAFSLNIIDLDGRMLATDDPAKLDSVDHGVLLRNLTARSDSGIVMTEIEGTAMAVVWTKSTMTDWKYVAVSPLSRYQGPVVAVLQTVALGAIIVAILGLVMVNFLTFRLYAPIQRIVMSARSQAATDGQEDDDDLAMVNSVIRHLSGRITGMERTLAENAPLIERAIVDDLVQGAIRDMAELNDRLRSIGKHIPGTALTPIVVEPLEGVLPGLPGEQREYVQYALLQLVSRSLGGTGGSLQAVQPGFRIAWIGSADAKPAIGELQEFIRIVRRELGIVVNVAICLDASGGAELEKAWATGIQAFRYAFFWGNGRVFAVDHLRGLEASSPVSETGLLRPLEIALKAKRPDEARRVLAALVADLGSGRLAYEPSMAMVRQIPSLVGRVATEQEIANGQLSKEEIDRTLPTLRHLDAFRDYMENLLAAFFRQRTELDVATCNGQRQAAVDYISGHLDQGISLSRMAEHFGMSDSHFSRWFRTTVGSSFSEYVVTQKMERARKLLVSEPATPVKEIARRLGYFDLSYFSALFRTDSAVSPVQYRKKMISRTEMPGN